LAVSELGCPVPHKPYSSTDMRSEFTYWQDGEFYVGYLNEFPDYSTQGVDIEDLKAHLLDLYKEFTSGAIPGVRRVAELDLA